MTLEQRSAILIEALPYIQKFRGHTFIIKYGGAAMEDKVVVERFLRDIVMLEAIGINPVIVHGGGKAITSRMKDAGIEARFVNGLRVTCGESVKIVESVLDREVNADIVGTIKEYGGHAVGFSGKNVFVAQKLPPQPNENGDLEDIGYVGEAVAIHEEIVRCIVRCEEIPVISPIGAAPDGQVFNINADLAAAALASQLKATKLIYASDVVGIMRDHKRPETLISSIGVGQIDSLIADQTVSGGMIPKLRSAAAAIRSGVQKVHMIGGHLPHCLLLEIFSNAGIGTEIVGE